MTMEKVELPIHQHPLLPFTRFAFEECFGCRIGGYIYGGYRCNELGCEDYVFHKECAESLPEINHSSHPDHPLKLIPSGEYCGCNHCRIWYKTGYCCSICDFRLCVDCAKEKPPLLVLQNPKLHEHPLELIVDGTKPDGSIINRRCKTCAYVVSVRGLYYGCFQCEVYFHVDCIKFYPEANHTSHPQHPLKQLTSRPDYADKNCLLCGMINYGLFHHHCDVCNFTICKKCMKTPPPHVVVSKTTHEHQLHLVPRRMDFTCNACGTDGEYRSPYFCLQCNFMIHRECIDLPRVININRHDHRVSYTRRLGHGNWKSCGVCRKKVDEFYGAYSCSKCDDFVVHSRCATRRDVWDKIELEGTPEEEEIPPFEVIDDYTIKHFSHHHNLRINTDGEGLHESKVCEACVFQICSETTFYSCEECDFILHQKCANLPRKKRHVYDNQRFTLHTDSQIFECDLCGNFSSGFKYTSVVRGYITLDVRCGSFSEPFEHKSHPHPLYYSSDGKDCTACGEQEETSCYCDKCDKFNLCFKCAMLPQKLSRHRYDDHPLSLCYGESINVDGEYWCEACETKVDPKKWFYTCNDCGTTLHISCVVGDFTYVKPSSSILSDDEGMVVSNTSICRPVCNVCNSRCILPSILKVSIAEGFVYICSAKCNRWRT